jgi:hypothetical protein
MRRGVQVWVDLKMTVILDRPAFLFIDILVDRLVRARIMRDRELPMI